MSSKLRSYKIYIGIGVFLGLIIVISTYKFSEPSRQLKSKSDYETCMQACTNENRKFKECNDMSVCGQYRRQR